MDVLAAYRQLFDVPFVEPSESSKLKNGRPKKRMDIKMDKVVGGSNKKRIPLKNASLNRMEL